MLPVMLTPPLSRMGFGKFGIPWARMHAENFSAFWYCCWRYAGSGGLFGSSFLQAACAVLNAAEDLSRLPLLLGNAPPGPGSGQDGSPCERIHLAKATACWYLCWVVWPAT